MFLSFEQAALLPAWMQIILLAAYCAFFVVGLTIFVLMARG